MIPAKKILPFLLTIYFCCVTVSADKRGDETDRLSPDQKGAAQEDARDNINKMLEKGISGIKNRYDTIVSHVREGTFHAPPAQTSGPAGGVR
jgi:hypothetical protein